MITEKKKTFLEKKKKKTFLEISRKKFKPHKMYLDTYTVLHKPNDLLNDPPQRHLLANKHWSVQIDRAALSFAPYIVQVPVYGNFCFAKNCPQIVAIGGPFCAQHTNEFYSVITKPTTLTVNGNPLPFQGLFANKNFAPQEPIIPYFHLCLFKGRNHSPCSTVIPDPYSMLVDGGTHSALQYRCAGALANTVLGRFKQDPLGRRVATSRPEACNVKFQITHEVDLVATRPISKGEELFADYGRKRLEFLDVHIINSPELKRQEHLRELENTQME